MKLRNKLKISFCIMVILPVIMCSIFAYAFFKYQATTIHQLYEVDSGELLDNFYSPVVLMGRMTENIYNEMKEVAETSPWQYNSVDFVKQLDRNYNANFRVLLSDVTAFIHMYLIILI